MGNRLLEIADHLISSGAVDLVVIDSVAALTPKSEIDGEMGDSKMGLTCSIDVSSSSKINRYN